MPATPSPLATARSPIVPASKGAGITSAELLPGARIVRAFNAIGAARMGSCHRIARQDWNAHCRR